MPLAFPSPDHLPCPDCGASLPVAGDPGHVCDEERRLEFRLVELRPEVERFAAEFCTWLETPDGRFAQFIAKQDR